MKPIDDREFRELCLAHALGALDAAGEAILFRALETADAARMQLFAEAVEEATHGSPASVPDARVKADLMEKVREDTAAHGNSRGVPGVDRGSREMRPPPPRRKPVFAYAALAFGVVMAGLALRQWHLTADTRVSLSGAQARIEALTDSLAAKQALLAVLQAPSLKVAALMPPANPQARTQHGAPDMARSTARILWDADKHSGLMRVSDMPPAPAGQDYFLWILVDDKADPCVNAGAFAVRAVAGADLYRFQGAADLGRFRILGFEITLETKGAVHTHADGKSHLHPQGRTLLKSMAFL